MAYMPLNQDEVEMVLDAPSSKSILGKRNRLALSLMAYGGLRIKELVGIRMRYTGGKGKGQTDVHMDGKVAYVIVLGKGHGSVKKNGKLRDKARRVYLRGQVLDRMLVWLAVKPEGDALFPVICGGARPKGDAVVGKPVSTQCIRQMVYHFSEKAIGRRINPHSLRHHTASKLNEVTGGDQALVGKVLGHEPTSVTGSYIHPSEDAIIDAMGKVSGSAEMISLTHAELEKIVSDSLAALQRKA